MIQITEIISTSNLEGKVIWICDYRWNSVDIENMHNIKPTKVLVKQNSKIDKDTYFSENYFVSLDDDNKTIHPYNYEWEEKYPVYCFNTKKECIDYYKSQIREILFKINEFKSLLCEELDSKILTLSLEFGEY